MDLFANPEILAAVVAAVVLAGALARRLFSTADVPPPKPAPPGEDDEAAPAVAPVAPEPAPEPVAIGLGSALANTRRRIAAGLAAALGRDSSAREEALEELEEALLEADVGVAVTQTILDSLRDLPESTDLRGALQRLIFERLDAAVPNVPTEKPWIILISGVNGVGKTTSIGKLAARFRDEGKSVLLVAADTFRAAAIEQLGVWAERSGAEIVQHKHGSDPAAVAFDGVKAGVARAVDVVLVDTAGRLHTQQNLMEELRKVHRVIGREVPGAPHDVWLVLDAATGQSALRQAKSFREALGLTGIILTKLDGTAKGGTALAIRHELDVPIRFIGVGEGIGDLRPFDPGEYAAALLED